MVFKLLLNNYKSKNMFHIQSADSDKTKNFLSEWASWHNVGYAVACDPIIP